MTKISQLSDIGGSLAAGDEFVIRDVSDISTPNKKVTASGFIDYVIAQGVGSGFTQISAGATAPASVRCFSSGTTREVIVTTSGVERARFLTDGTLRLLNSPGIDFSQLQVNAAGMTSETLDSYEEGTWTPVISNTGYTYTYSNQTGTYTKVGRTVTLSWRVAVTARSGSASGGLAVVTIPFTSSASFTGSALMSPQPSQLVIHKAATGSTSGVRTFLYSGLANGNTSNLWIGAVATTGDPFDIGSDFHMGGVFTYEV